MIYFFFGQNSCFSGKKVSEIKARFLEKNPTGSGLAVLEVENGEKKVFLPELAKALGAKGLFFSKQLLIVRNLLLHSSAASLKEVLEYLQRENELLADQDRVVIFWEEGVPKEKEKLFQYLEKNAKKQKFEMLSGFKLAEWIAKEAQSINPDVSFSREAISGLISYVPNDLQRLSLEIEKLVSFKGQGEITERDVELLVKADVEANIFEAVEALSGGNKAKALKLYHEQIAKGEDPFYVMSMYIYQFRNLLKIGEFFFAGEQNNYALAKLAGLHPFVVQKGMAQLRGTSLEKLKATYQKLADLDFKIKTGELDPKLALDKFIVEC
jgi:DNA polymerase-3 subunit delta